MPPTSTAAWAARRYELCRLLGGGRAERGLLILLVAERRAELRLGLRVRQSPQQTAQPHRVAQEPAPGSERTRKRREQRARRRERAAAAPADSCAAAVPPTAPAATGTMQPQETAGRMAPVQPSPTSAAPVGEQHDVGGRQHTEIATPMAISPTASAPSAGPSRLLSAGATPPLPPHMDGEGSPPPPPSREALDELERGQRQLAAHNPAHPRSPSLRPGGGAGRGPAAALQERP